MYHREIIAHIARRLPHQTQRDVNEVVDLLLEVWADQLAQGEAIVLPEIGRLSIEIQSMQAGGALAKYGQVRRIYGRFRLTPGLKEQIEEAQNG